MNGVLSPAGAFARADAPLAWALLAGALLVTAGVLLLLARAVTGPPRPVRPRVWWLGGGLLFPGVVLAALAWTQLGDIARQFAVLPAHVPLVHVQGRMWWWQLRVDGVVSANELVLPVGRTVRLTLEASDVIHSLWVPPLAGKMDLVPGRVNHLLLQADAPGAWRAPCAEFCGPGHALMALQVVALAPADYAAWRANQQLAARPPATPQQHVGRSVFVAQGCGACHTVRGVTQAALPEGSGGPDLTHLASRRTLGAGVQPNGAAGLRAWITGVQRLKPGARMPQYEHLDEASLDALVAWLASLE